MHDHQKLAYDIPTFCKLYSIGRTSVYQEIKENRLHPVKIGRRTLIPAAEATRWLENLSTGPVETTGV